MKKLVLALCLFLLPVAAQAEVRVLNDQVWYRVYFGLGVGSAVVQPELLYEFMSKEVSPRFPMGFAVTPTAHGQWLSEQGVIREKNIIMDLTVPDTPESEQNITAVAEAYSKRFGKAKASAFVVRIPVQSTSLFSQHP